MRLSRVDRDETETPDGRFTRRVLIVLGLVALAFAAWQLRSVLLMLFGAVVVATIVRAIADPVCQLDADAERLGGGARRAAHFRRGVAEWPG